MNGNDVFAKLSSLDLDLTNESGTVRIYPNYVRMGDKMYPQICYSLENYQLDQALDGSPRTGQVDIKVNAIGQTYSAATQLGFQVVQLLDQTSGMWGATKVQGAFVEDVAEDHFVDTDMATILYYSTEATIKTFFQLA